MTPLIVIATSLAMVGLGFLAGCWWRGRKATRETAIGAYVMCGLLMSIREALDDNLDDLKDYVTAQARTQHDLWQSLDGSLPGRSLTIDRNFHKAHEEFTAGRRM